MSYPNTSHVFFAASLTIYLIFVLTSTDTRSQRSVHEAQGNYLILELSEEGLIVPAYQQNHAASQGTSPPMTGMLYRRTDDLAKPLCTTNHPGSHAFNDRGGGILETSAFRPFVDPASQAFTVFDKIKGSLPLPTHKVENLGQPLKKTLIGALGMVETNF